MAPSDDDLLRQYVCDSSNPAFTELVRRYLDAIYSAALRHVRSSALAEEVSQSVFLDLSKNAAKLKSGQPLIAWLYLVTRRTAIDFIRRESRRQTREQTASEIAAMKSSPSVWVQIEPFLDEALETLNEEDRQALLLRYIACKSLREVGENLGTSEDAAQKRISRALERLRTLFARRGIVITAAGLATDLSANVVSSAPAGLGATVAAGAFPAAAIVHSVAMTALNKTLIAASVVIAAGLVYQNQLIATQRDQTSQLEQEIAGQKTVAIHLQEERNRAEELLSKKRKELEENRAGATENATVEADLEAWLARVNQLKEFLAKMPDKNIPEMKFLTTNDWLAATLNNSLKTDAKVRLALGSLRLKAKLKVVQNFQGALLLYSQAHGGSAPTDWAGLRPFLLTPLDDDILQRYDFGSEAATDTGKKATANRGVLNEKAAVDEDHDQLFHLSLTGFSMERISHFGDRVNEARQAYITAHNGEFPADSEQLLPYFKTPVDRTELKEFSEAGQP